jgi:DNA-binding CsgD family transcriptional regulator
MVDLLGRLSNPGSEPVGSSVERVDPPTAAVESRTDHQVQRRLGVSEVNKMVDRREAGETIEQLAERFGVHRTTVMAHLRRQGVPRQSRSRTWSDSALLAEVDRYMKGASLADIAERHGISPSTVARRLKRAGVELRPRPGWGHGPHRDGKR